MERLPFVLISNKWQEKLILKYTKNDAIEKNNARAQKRKATLEAKEKKTFKN